MKFLVLPHSQQTFEEVLVVFFEGFGMSHLSHIFWHARTKRQPHHLNHQAIMSSRRSALMSRLAVFEKNIAENEKYGGTSRNFLTTVASNPGKDRFRSNRHSKLSCVPEAPDSPTCTVSTDVSTTSIEDMDLASSAMENLNVSLSLIRFELEGLPDEPEMAETKKIEAELNDIMNDLEALEASMALDFDIEDEGEEKETGDDGDEQDESMEKANDSKVFDASLSDLYDGTSMLMNWDTTKSAMQYRAWKERKSRVDTGARISFKDRMKAFSC